MDFPPNKALQMFEPLIGVWKTTGTHGMIPDTILHGQTEFAWHESGAFIRMASSITEDVGIPTCVAIIASDDASATYYMMYYDQRGVSRKYNVSMEGNTMKWWRDSPEFSQRYSLTVSDDKQTLVGKGELSRDGITCEKDLDLTYKRI